MSILRRLAIALLVLAAAASGAEVRPSCALKAGDRLALIGDSITEQKIYTRYVAIYLLASSGVPDLDIAQLGWAGERAGGWAGRWRTSTAWFGPTVATTCYGMNDGEYRAWDDGIGAAYRQATAAYLAGMARAGVRELVVGSPGAVDTATFRGPSGAAEYNRTLGRLAEAGAALAAERGVRSADLHHPLMRAMESAKAAKGAGYLVAGADGVHAGENGHLVMAGALLAALGCDGAIGRIELRADGTAAASASHAVVAARDGVVELESARWPFVIPGDGAAPDAARGILPFTDFIDRLDRLVVAMPACRWRRAAITWGERTVVVDGARLTTGVNLMAEFAVTPFDRPSEALWHATFALQEFERHLVKDLLCRGRNQDADAGPAPAADEQARIAQAVAERQAKAAAVRALVRPVRHRIAVAEAR